MTGRAAGRLFGGGIVAMALSGMVQAMDDGYGPDAWQVTGVAPNDVLNVRMGPGTQYPVVASFTHDQRGLRQVTCVPLMTFEQFNAMSAAQHAALPPRWCLMHDADRLTRGWVAARFLAEDAAPPPNAAPAHPGDGAMLENALTLVRDLYAAHEQEMRGGGPGPLHPSRAADFFSVEVVRSLAGGLQADPIHGGQDSDISGLRILPDPAEPMLRGMVTVHAGFLNFGHPQRATFRLRADPGQPGAPLRIFRIEHEGWAFE